MASGGHSDTDNTDTACTQSRSQAKSWLAESKCFTETKLGFFTRDNNLPVIPQFFFFSLSLKICLKYTQSGVISFFVFMLLALTVMKQILR